MRRKIGCVALALAGALVLGACASDDDATSLPPAPSATSLTAEPTTTSTTSATPVTTTSSTRATGAPSTTLRPVFVEGVPQVTATPSRAVVGAVVRIEGSGFTDATWRSGGTLWLVGGSGGCSLYAEARHTITVSSSGRLTGTFTVPAVGDCRMSDLPPRPVSGGTYRLAFACTACLIGAFEVVAAPGECADVAFAPNSDNLATGIVATGLSCADAEALVRKVGAQVRAVGGPARVEVDGYVCVRTGENSDPGLPASDFACTSGSRKVTFRRL